MRLAEERGKVLRLVFVSSDRTLLITALALFATGIFSIFSASLGMEEKAGAYVTRQAIWGLVSLTAYAATLRIGYLKLLDMAYRLYGVALLLLVLVLVLGHGVRGSQSWIGFAGFRLQPSEVTKVALALLMAKHPCMHPAANLKSLAVGLGFSRL